MLAKDFAEKCRWVAESVPTQYRRGGWGQPTKISGKTFFIFDCVCFVKSLIDGFAADPNKPYGGATYGKPCPDAYNDVMSMLKKHCVDVSSDMSNIMPGEFLAYIDYSHCGIYLGGPNKEVVECTPRWKNGVQITRLDQPERKSLWGFHGKLWEYMDYNYRPEYIGIQTGAYKSEANARKYMRNKKIQHMFYVEPYYKVAYTFDTEAEARAALPGIQEDVKGAFITKYKASDLVL